ncbi:MAG: histidinol-phosphatase HisJ family protein [Candidatus Metalachnospira sp.]|nr:histidinol-phosphatase HisJ family protein [Candidatus Metalachnospira sp.]
MYFADYHIHTSFSSDSTATMQEMIEKAISLGLKEIMITDHMDIAFPSHDMLFTLNYSEYSDMINLYKVLYQKKIDVLIGVEMGLQSHIVRDARMFTEYNPFDFVIGSTHVVDGLDISKAGFFVGKTKNEAYMRYFESVLENAKLHDCYNVYGHIDYINRYSNYEDNSLNYDDYKEIIDEILKVLVDKGKGLDINTSGFRYGFERTNPQFEIVKRFKELGGEIVTVGSDAHRPEGIAEHFDDAYKMLKAAGFKAIASYRNKKPTMVDIKNFM